MSRKRPPRKPRNHSNPSGGSGKRSSNTSNKHDRKAKYRAGGSAWKKREKSLAKLPHGISEVVDGMIFLGSGRDAWDLDALRAEHIGAILNVSKEWPNRHKKHFSYHTCNLSDVDDEVLSVKFESAFDFINKAITSGVRVFVHCVVGKSRSPALVIAWLMRERSMSLRQAFDHVKGRRDIIQPNDGFMRQLQQYELEVFHLESLDHCTMKPGDWVSWSAPKASKKKGKGPRGAAIEDEDTRAIVMDLISDGGLGESAWNEELVRMKGDGIKEDEQVGSLIRWAHSKAKGDSAVKLGLEEQGIAWNVAASIIAQELKRWWYVQRNQARPQCCDGLASE